VIAAGVVAGVVGALLLSQVVASLLYQVSPRDPMVLAGATLAIGLVGLAATLIPAYRATRADPMVALREE
jgi:ABC-type antimicrobial peptide transport system permease subunit